MEFLVLAKKFRHSARVPCIKEIDESGGENERGSRQVEMS